MMNVMSLDRWNMTLNYKNRAVRHDIRVEKNNSGETRAVRHDIRVEPNVYNIVPSHTGRDITPHRFCYPYQIPNGIWAKTISENFKELAI